MTLHSGLSLGSLTYDAFPACASTEMICVYIFRDLIYIGSRIYLVTPFAFYFKHSSMSIKMFLRFGCSTNAFPQISDLNDLVFISDRKCQVKSIFVYCRIPHNQHVPREDRICSKCMYFWHVWHDFVFSSPC